MGDEPYSMNMDKFFILNMIYYYILLEFLKFLIINIIYLFILVDLFSDTLEDLILILLANIK